MFFAIVHEADNDGGFFSGFLLPVPLRTFRKTLRRRRRRRLE